MAAVAVPLASHSPTSPLLLSQPTDESSQRAAAASSPSGDSDGDSGLEALWSSTRHAAHSLSSPSSSSSSSSTRCERVLESGHVFVRHVLSGRSVLSERVVLFVVRGVLYACKHARHQSRYRQPFLSLPLSAATADRPLLVYMGKQTAALRLVPAGSTPERRCFALSLQSTLLELEAPASGDVRYWLRSLYEVLTRSFALSTSQRSLVFLPAQPVAADVLQRTDWRMRQLRMDGQRTRRREEADRRLNGQQRLLDEKGREERLREEQCEQLRQRWLAAQHEAEDRVTAASCGAVSPSRALLEERVRLDGDRRMHEAFRREADVEVQRRRHLAVQPPQHVPALASEYAKHNQRCTALQTHTRAPLLTHTARAESDGLTVANESRRPLGSSKSSPNLIAALSSLSLASFPSSSSSSAVAPPAPATRSLSGPALPLRSLSPSQRRLPSLKPHSLSSNGSSAASSQPSSLPDSPRTAQPATAQPLSADILQSETATDDHLVPASPASSTLSPSSTSTSLSTPRPSRLSSSALSPSAAPFSFRLSKPVSVSPSSCRSSLPSFDQQQQPTSPLSSLPYGSSLYSPTHCLPVTAVYSVHSPSVAVEQPHSGLAAALSAMSAASLSAAKPIKSAAAMPEPFSSPPASSPSAIRFQCDIQLPTDFPTAQPLFDQPLLASSASYNGAATHFHFHLHTAAASPASASSSSCSGWTAAWGSPPPYTTTGGGL